MSITNSLYIGANGITAHGDAISVVGDNIANASTIGFKRGRAGFADVLGGTLNGQRLGSGVRLGGVQTMYDQGTLQQTGSALDLAIRGNGFFAVRGENSGVDSTYYTRDGRFHLDNSGYVVNPGGLRLQGYPIDGAGNRAATYGDLPLAARQSPPQMTTTAGLTFNLSSGAPVATVPFDITDPSATSQWNTSMTVHDSLGGAHQVNLYFVHTGPNTWEYHASVDGSEVTGGVPGVQSEITNPAPGGGTLVFNTDGSLQSQTGSIAASFLGAMPNQPIVVDFGDDIASGGTGFGGTTQYAAVTDGVNGTVTGTDVDGRASGNLESLSITETGVIQGIFDNGDRVDLAQLALADFASEDGLRRAGDGLFSATPDSGQALFDVVGTGGRGAISSGALEASNVDLGNELVTLIAYQRAFQANSKTVTTADEMMAEINSLKR